MSDMYQANSGHQQQIADAALKAVNLLEGHITDTMHNNHHLASNWQSDASTTFIDQTMKKLLQQVESVKGVCHAYHGAANNCADITSSTEKTNVHIVT